MFEALSCVNKRVLLIHSLAQVTKSQMVVKIASMHSYLALRLVLICILIAFCSVHCIVSGIDVLYLKTEVLKGKVGIVSGMEEGFVVVVSAS